MHFNINKDTPPKKVYSYKNMYAIDSASHPSPSMVLTGDFIPKIDNRWRLDLSISHMSYEGYHRNLQHNHVYDIITMDNKKLMFPKGKYYAHIYGLIRYSFTYLSIFYHV